MVNKEVKVNSQSLFIHRQLDHFDDKYNSWMIYLTKGSSAITVRNDILSSRAECHARGDPCVENVTTKPIYMRDTWEQGSRVGTQYTLFTAWNNCGELFTRRCTYQMWISSICRAAKQHCDISVLFWQIQFFHCYWIYLIQTNHKHLECYHLCQVNIIIKGWFHMYSMHAQFNRLCHRICMN